MTTGTYRPTDVCDAGIAEKLAIPTAYLRRMRDQVPALYDQNVKMLTERDNPPEYILIAMSDEIVSRCGTIDYTSRETGAVHRDLRRALKAIAMKYRIPTQILQQPTIDGRDRTPLSRIAWNFFTGMYCKAGGYPWSPHSLAKGTCYVGIGFYRPLGRGSSTMQTSLIQAFDEHGEGLERREAYVRGHQLAEMRGGVPPGGHRKAPRRRAGAHPPAGLAGCADDRAAHDDRSAGGAGGL